MNLNNNNQVSFINFIKIFVLVFVLTVAVNVSAQSFWTPPSSDPPGGNTPAPINESVNAQIKQGPLAVWNTIRALGGIFFPISINDLSGGGGVGFNILSSANVLDIIGSGTAPDRKVKIWDDLDVEGDTNIGGDVTIEGNIIGGNTSQICTGDGSCLDLIEVTNITGGSKWAQQGTGDNIYRLNGNVGIGTASPTSILEIATSNSASYLGTGSASISPPETGTLLRLNNNNGSGNFASLLFQVDNSAINKGDINFVKETDGGFNSAFTFRQRTGGGTYAEQMRIQSNGNVGIGTTSPSAQLHTTGNVRLAGTAAGTASTQTRLVTIDSTGLLGWKDQSSLPSGTGTVGPFTDGHILIGSGSNPAITSSGSLTWDSSNSRLTVGPSVSLGEGTTVATPKVLIVNTDTSTSGNSYPQGLHVKNAGRGWGIYVDSTGPIKNGLRVGGGVWAEGPVRLSNGVPGPNKILVSTDASGNTTWKTLTEIIETDPESPPGPVASDYLQTTFSLCNSIACLIKTGSSSVTHNIAYTLEGPVVKMKCPTGYRVISGGATCKADHDLVGFAVGALAYTTLGISRPTSATDWETQCRSEVFVLGIASGSVDLPSRTKEATIICQKI